MKDKLLKLLNKKKELRDSLISKGDTCEDITELRGINSQVEQLNVELRDLQEMIDGLEEEGAGDPIEGRGAPAPITGGLNPLGTYGLQGARASADDKEMEYRQAFMKHVLTGADIPSELRAAATTTTVDLGVVLPKTVMNQIVEKLKFYGNIFSRVTQTNIKGGVSIPKASAKPTATWVAEGTTADKQKKTVDGEISFVYHKLQVKVAITLEAETTSLSVFETTVIDNMYEAIIVALESAILNGTGTKQPLGITKDTSITATQKIKFKAAEIGSWTKWSKTFAKVPLSKRTGSALILNNETYEGDITGMVDTNGQPIARTNYGIDGTETYRLKGKEVIVVEDYLPTFEAAANGDVFGVIVNLKDYMLNSNLQMSVKKYFDEATDEWIHKVTVIADGKLSDAQGVLLLVKDTTTA